MIGILGGTFDPVHVAHLRCALEVQQNLRLSEIRFIPSRQPPHRPPPFADAGQRTAMLRLAIAGQPGWTLDERELRREGPSYTVDTLRSLREEVGSRPICLLLGIDAFAELDTWHEWKTLPALTHFVVMRRPGSSKALAPAVQSLVEQRLASDATRLRQNPAGGVLFLRVTQLDVSATRIRELAAAGESIRYLVPDRVFDFIQREGLYHRPDLHAAGGA